MWMMLQQEKPDDYVIATGTPHSLQEFVEAAFGHFDLNWREHVTIDPSLFRPSDIACGFGDAGKAQQHLGWRAEATMRDVVGRMAAAELASKPETPE